MSNAVIIGAGPAGSLAGLLLARAGWQITLIEQHRFPRDKVCGECLSSTGIDVLRRAGIANFSIPPVQLTNTSIHAPDGSSADIPLPRPMWGLSRNILDAHLLNAAISAGVKLRQPVRCERTRPAVLLRDLVTNRVETLTPQFVMIADGKPMGPAEPTGEFGIKTHFTGVHGPRDSIELFGVEGSYGGLAPIEGDRWNAAFVVSAARLRSTNGDVDALFKQLVVENRTLSKRLRNAQRTSPWLTAPLPRSRVADRWLAGIIPIGNTAAALEPIGGEGMGLALRSAELATSAMIDAGQRGLAVDVDRLRRDYRGLWDVRRTVCRAVAVAVSSRQVASWLTPAIDGCGSLTNSALSLMGKAGVISVTGRPF